MVLSAPEFIEPEPIQVNDEIHITVEECYGHCGKALIRSDFWTAAPIAAPPSDISAFVAECRFMALATTDAQGSADLSPKGDPAGMMVHLESPRLWFADRPGNRRVDSFRNIITQPRVAAALLIPGSNHVVKLSGTAHMTADEAARAQFTVQDKTPALAICIDDLSVTISQSAALVRTHLWPVADRRAEIEPAKVFTEHIKLNKTNGLGARLTSAALSVPGVTGLLKKGLQKEYKDNLY